MLISTERSQYLLPFYPQKSLIIPGNEKSLFIWPPKCIYLLLNKYEEREGEFVTGVKRHNKIWEAIADDMRKMNSEYTMTGPQCQSKLNGLKKTYKKILDHNSISGNDRKTWPYLTVGEYINFMLFSHIWRKQ